MKEKRKIFNVANDKENVVCPPNQVFSNPNFEFLLTTGGYLVNDEMEYKNLWKVLSQIGESEFYISENIGATKTERNIPFETTIDLSDNFKAFEEKVENFDYPFGSRINHFFVFGKNPNWGIYICEYPTLNIIGCDKSISDKFRQAYSINGNGYDDLKDFIVKEFESSPNHIDEFENLYNLTSNYSPNR